MIDGRFAASLKSFGVIVNPIANINVDKAYCIICNDPSVGAMTYDSLTPMNADRRVHRGANLQNMLEKDCMFVVGRL